MSILPKLFPAGTWAASTALSCLILSDMSSAAHAALQCGWSTDFLTTDARQRGILSLLSQFSAGLPIGKWRRWWESLMATSRAMELSAGPWSLWAGVDSLCCASHPAPAVLHRPHALMGRRMPAPMLCLVFPSNYTWARQEWAAEAAQVPCREQSHGRMDMGLTKVYWYYKDLWDYRWEMYVSEVIAN